MKILVVDDKPDNVELLCQILEDDYDVITADNGADCIKLAKEQQPELIILDVMMPILDGYDVLQLLQEDESTSDIPVIFLTANYKDTDRVVKGLKSGAFDYITKPVNDEVLLAKVNTAMRVKQAENEVKKKNAELEKANEKLKELDTLKSMFIASMSHELRTPLNSIIGFTGTILQGMTGEINDEQKKQLTMVKKSAGHLLALITEILDITRIETGKIDTSVENFDLSSMLGEIKDSFKVLTDKKGVVITFAIPEFIPIESDRQWLGQIVNNLVSNAVKFTDRGEIKIRVSRKDDMAEVSVEDTGIGIRESDMEKLFKAFSQIRTEGAMAQGTGLGLYLCKKIADLLNGKITVESKYGEGSVFTLTVPLKYTNGHRQGISRDERREDDGRTMMDEKMREDVP